MAETVVHLSCQTLYGIYAQRRRNWRQLQPWPRTREFRQFRKLSPFHKVDFCTVASISYALWRGAGWNVDNRDALIVLLETLEAIEKYFEDGVLDPLRSDLRYLGCINGCNGSWIPVSLDRPRPQPPKTQPYARTFNQCVIDFDARRAQILTSHYRSQACQKVIESLEKTRIALLETDDRIMEL